MKLCRLLLCSYAAYFFTPQSFFAISFELVACSSNLCGTAWYATRCGFLLSASFFLVIRICIPDSSYSFVREMPRLPLTVKQLSKFAFLACVYMCICMKSCMLQRSKVRILQFKCATNKLKLLGNRGHSQLT